MQLRKLFVLTTIVLLASAPAWSQDIVREDGAGGAFTSIQAAIDGGSNAIISVEQTNTGTIDAATMDVTRSVAIQNDTGDNVLLTSSQGDVFSITSDVTVTIQGFEIADATGCGVKVSATNADVTVLDCNLHDNNGHGIANWNNVKSAEVLCEGSPGELFPSDGAIAAITTMVTLSGCTIDSGTPEGAAVVIFFGTVNVNDSDVSAQAAASSSNFGINECVLGLGAGHLNVNNSFVRLKGLNDGYIINALGFTSLLSDGSGGSQIDTVNVDRSLLRIETDDVVGVQGVRTVQLGVGNRDVRTQSTFTNTILDLNGLVDGDSNAFFITEAIADFNYCTILGDNNGSNQAGRRGITGNDGSDQTVRVANTLFGNLGADAVGNDGGAGNSITIAYCHLWNNGANIGGDIGTGTATNITFDDPPFLNGRYEITVPNAEFTDAGIGSLIADPATVVDDFDELGVRPRGAANDKGAQEGLQPEATATPYIPNTGIQTWEVYR